MPPTLYRSIDDVRRLASKELDPARRSKLGQFMTPSMVADFMASLFTKWPKEIYLLDPGAGVGSLTESFVRKSHKHSPKGRKLSVVAYEIEQSLADHLSNNFSQLKKQSKEIETTLENRIEKKDFIEEAVRLILQGETPYTHVILNPPYKKILTGSEHRTLLRQVGIETTNLYSAFLALSIALTKKGGEVVAIIPRSFCNGPYFRPFRQWLQTNASIAQIHVFESRKKAFHEDGVLQENVIVHFIRCPQGDTVKVSASKDVSFEDYTERLLGIKDVIHPEDQEGYIRIPELSSSTNNLFSHNLEELQLSVATGPVVDFRVKDLCFSEPNPNAAPLLYPHHFVDGKVTWPRTHKKPNAILVGHQTQKLLMPKGCYVVIRRFSSKEEKRRINASVLDPSRLLHDFYGFENHLNVIHFKKEGIEPDIAHGVALFLNSTIIDSYFRTFSGHTQVNATDLRSMRFPDRKTLASFGKWAQKQNEITQEKIDNFIEAYAE